MDIETTRRLMSEALEDCSVGAGEALSRLALWELEKGQARAELESERLLWRAEREELRESARDLSERLRTLQESGAREAELMQAMALDLKAQRSAMDAELRAREEKLERGRIDLEQREAELGIKMRALEQAHRQRMASLLRETEQLLAGVRSAGATGTDSPPPAR